MLLVITGCDKTGKSTLAGNLCALTGAEYQHYSKPPKKGAVKYFSKVFKNVHKKLVIADRWMEGDKVYAAVCKHGRALREQDSRRLLKKATKHGLMYIFCFDDDAAVMERFRDCGETFLTPSQVTPIQNAFWKEACRFAKMDKFPVIAYNSFRNEALILSYGDPTSYRFPHIIPFIISEGLEGRDALRP